MSKQTQLLTKQIGTWPLETRPKTDTVHTGCLQLWSKIRWQRTCPTPQKGTVVSQLYCTVQTVLLARLASKARR